MRFYSLLFLLVSTSLFGVGPDEVLSNWKKGEYEAFYTENHYLYSLWMKEGIFKEFLMEREQKHQLYASQISQVMQVQSRGLKEINQLTDEEIHMLELAIEKQPDLSIAERVRRIIEFQQMAMEHRDAVNAYALIEVGACDLVTDPVAFQVNQLLREYALKDMLVLQNVIEHQINQEKGDELAAALSLERDKKIREICARYPASQTSRLCLEALLVNEKNFYVGFDKGFFNDLLTSMRPPENEVEQNVKEIFRTFRLKKETLYKNLAAAASADTPKNRR